MNECLRSVVAFCAKPQGAPGRRVEEIEESEEAGTCELQTAYAVAHRCDPRAGDHSKTGADSRGHGE